MYIWRGENYRGSVLHLRECSLSAKRPKTFLTFLLSYVPYSIRDFFLTVVLTIPRFSLHPKQILSILYRRRTYMY